MGGKECKLVTTPMVVLQLNFKGFKNCRSRKNKATSVTLAILMLLGHVLKNTAYKLLLAILLGART